MLGLDRGTLLSVEQKMAGVADDNLLQDGRIDNRLPRTAKKIDPMEQAGLEPASPGGHAQCECLPFGNASTHRLRSPVSLPIRPLLPRILARPSMLYTDDSKVPKNARVNDLTILSLKLQRVRDSV